MMRQLVVFCLCGIILVCNTMVLSGCARWDSLWAGDRSSEQGETIAQERVPAKVSEPSAGDLATAETTRLRIVQKSQVADVLEYLAAFQTLSDERQEAEFRKVAKLYEGRRSDLDRFRLALVILTPGKSFSNALKGGELLQQFLKEEKDPEDDLAALARLLVRMVEHQKSLEGQLARETENAQALAQQLNELKNIENIMRKREVDSLPGM